MSRHQRVLSEPLALHRYSESEKLKDKSRHHPVDVEERGAGGIVETSEGGVEGCTGSVITFVVSFSGGLAGGSGWSGEGVVVKGAGGEAGVSSGSTVSTGCNGEVVGTSFSGVLAGGSGWSGEGVVVTGASGETGSTVSTGCNGEVVGEKEVQVVEAFPLTIVVEGEGEVTGNGAGRHWEMGDKSSSSSSSESLSRSSSALHRRLAAFRVRLAGGEAIVAGEETSG